MDSLRLTHWLLLIIALALLVHAGFALWHQPVGAATFRLDSCITNTPNDKLAAFVHGVMHVHGVTEVESAMNWSADPFYDRVISLW